MPQGNPTPGGPGTQVSPGGPAPTDLAIIVDEDGVILTTDDGEIMTGTAADGCCCGDNICDRVYYRYEPCPRDNQHINCPGRVPPIASVYLRCDRPCPDACGQAQGTTRPPGIRFKAPGSIRWCYQATADQFYDPVDFNPPGDPPPEGLPQLPPGAIKVPAGSFLCTSGCNNTCCECHAFVCGQKCQCDQSTRPTTCVEGWRFYNLDDDPDVQCITGECTDFTAEQGYPTLPPGAVLIGNLGTEPCCQNCRSNARCPDCNVAEGRYEYLARHNCFASDDVINAFDYRCCCSESDTVVEYAYESHRVWTSTCQQFEIRSDARGRITLRVGEPGYMHITQSVERLDHTIDIYEYDVFLAPGCAPISNLQALESGTDFIHGFIGASLVRTVSADCGVALMNKGLTGCPNEDGSAGPCTGSTLDTILSVTHSHGPRSTACRANCGDFGQVQERPGQEPMSSLDLLRMLAA